MPTNNSDLAFQRNGKIIRRMNDDDSHMLNAWDDIEPSRPRALLMIHGYTSVPGIFLPMKQALTDKGYSLSCPLLAGHGQDFERFEKSTPKDWFDSVIAAYQTLRQDYDKVDVLGFSLGGVLACELASKQAVERLFLFAPAFQLPAPIKAMKAVLKAKQLLGFKQFKGVAGNARREGATELAYHKIPIKPSLALADYIEKMGEIRINAPTEIFLGKHDRVVSSKRVAKHFAHQANIHLTMLENSAHLIPLDNDIEQVLARF